MRFPSRDWLPAGTGARPDVRRVIDDAIKEWSQRWIAAQKIRPLRWRSAHDSPAAGAALPAEWTTPGGGVAIDLQQRRRDAVLAAALDADIATVAINERDRQLLDSLTNDMMADLAARIEKALGQSVGSPISDPGVGNAGMALFVDLSGTNGTVLLSVAIPDQLLVRFVKNAIARRSRPPLTGHYAAAIADVRLVIEATLGHASIPLGDLRALARGDVIILDRPLADPVDLALARSGTVVARGRLGGAQDRRTLTLSSD